MRSVGTETTVVYSFNNVRGSKTAEVMLANSAAFVVWGPNYDQLVPASELWYRGFSPSIVIFR